MSPLPKALKIAIGAKEKAKKTILTATEKGKDPTSEATTKQQHQKVTEPASLCGSASFPFSPLNLIIKNQASGLSAAWVESLGWCPAHHLLYTRLSIH